MRRLALSLSFAACSVANPVFGVEDSGSEATTRTTAEPSTGSGSAATDETSERPPTTSVGSQGTTLEPTTAGLDDTGVTATTGMSGTSTVSTTTPGETTDPSDTDSTSEMTLDPDGGMSDTLMEPTCMVPINVVPERIVKQDGQPIQCMEGMYTFIGPISQNGGFILVTDKKTCSNNPDPNPKVYELGGGWDMAIDIAGECVQAVVVWDKSHGDCRIGSIAVREYASNVPGEFIFLGSFFPISSLNLPPKPVFEPYMPCDCPMDMMDCCNGKAPGLYKLGLMDGEALPGQTVDTLVGPTAMKFRNINSFIDPGCLEDPNNIIQHVDWIAFRNKP